MAIHEWIARGSVSEDIAKERGYEELIRCENCQFYFEGQNEVDFWMRCRLHSINTTPDDFCSWAAKINRSGNTKCSNNSNG